MTMIAADKKAFRIHQGEAALARLATTSNGLTPFQQAGFLAPLLRGVNALDDFRLIEIRADGGALLLPVSIVQLGLFRLADIAGGKQASFHAATSDGLLAISAQTLRRHLINAGREIGIDAFTFSDCPLTYNDRDNPLAILARQASPSSGWKLALEGEAEEILARLSDRDDRKKLRQKANRLAALGTIHAGWAETPEARAAAFEALFRWKAERFGAAGIDDPFATDAIRTSLAAMAETGVLRLFTLRAGNRLVAVLAGLVGDRCFSGMLNGHEPEAEIARTSPGEQLLPHLIRALCADGFRHFDLGVGEARYKAHYCPARIALVDCAVAASAKGILAARLFLAMRAAKRTIKQSPKLMELLTRLRRLRSGKPYKA
ncbi:MAG: GNAT family N-acetyltransferase [Rhizobiales bacterium]|nr:GNAT family N-acetyltransferase [Hyphomicrobiales bacterium]